MRKLLFILLNLSAIVCLAYAQTGIKAKPQIYFIVFSAVTTLALFTNRERGSRVLYLILISLLYYVAFFTVSMLIIDLIAPDRATTYLEDGSMVKLMDFSFIYAVMVGLVLSLITILVYLRNRKKTGLIDYEKYVALSVFVTTSVQYCIFEL